MHIAITFKKTLNAVPTREEYFERMLNYISVLKKRFFKIKPYIVYCYPCENVSIKFTNRKISNRQ